MTDPITEARPIWWRPAWNTMITLLESLFRPPHGALGRALSIAWLAGLFLFGVYQWGIFYSWGNISFDFLDWAEVTGPRIAVLQDAMRQGVLPLHVANTTALRGVTDRYFAIPDTPFSPEILLLRWLDMGHYLFAGTLLLYTAGFAALVLLYRRYRLSPFVFTILFLLFNFNGDISAHLAVGHSIYTAYFLLPFFVLLALDLVEREQVGWGWQLGMAALLLVTLGQGLFHMYVWCLLFLGILALINLRLLKPVVIAGVFAVLVSLWRLLPPSLVLESITHEYMGGFATLTDFLSALLVLKDPDTAMQSVRSITHPLSWWELDYFIGLLGFAFIVLFGVTAPLVRERLRKTPSVQILVASLIFTALSVGQIFGTIIKILPVPPFTAERVSARLFALPLAALLVLAAIYMQREIDRRKLVPGVLLALLGLALMLYHDLSQHLATWRIRYIDGLVNLFPKVPFDPAQHTIQNHPDGIYTAMLGGGALVALGSLLFLAIMAWRASRRSPLL